MFLNYSEIVKKYTASKLIDIYQNIGYTKLYRFTLLGYIKLQAYRLYFCFIEFNLTRITVKVHTVYNSFHSFDSRSSVKVLTSRAKNIGSPDSLEDDLDFIRRVLFR